VRTRRALMLSGNVCLALMLAVVVVAGCAKEAPAPSPTPSPQPTVVLRLNGLQAPENHVTVNEQLFADLVEERTGGRVKIETYAAGSLYAQEDAAMGVASGAIAFSQVPPEKTAGLAPAAEFSLLPFLFKSWDESLEFHNEVAWDIVDRQFQANGAKLVFYESLGSDAGFVTVDKQIKTLEDLKGLKLRIYGDVMNKWMNAAGASPTFLAFAEVYTSLATGAIDGAMSTYDAYYEERWCEVTNYLVAQPFSLAVFPLIANLDVWNDLPEDIQDIMLEAGSEAQEQMLMAAKEADAHYLGLLEDELEINYLSEEEVARWEELATPFYAEWGTGCPACGEIMDALGY